MGQLEIKYFCNNEATIFKKKMAAIWVFSLGERPFLKGGILWYIHAEFGACITKRTICRKHHANASVPAVTLLLLLLLLLLHLALLNVAQLGLADAPGVADGLQQTGTTV